MTEKPPWSKAARWLLITLGAALVALWAPLPAGALEPAGKPLVITPSGQGLASGGSATPFTLRLPSGARCPGDTYHHGYLIFSYVVPTTLDPSSLTFPSNFPRSGVDLITVVGVPFVTQATDPYAATIATLPDFSWSRYDHDTAELPLGTYNVGIACAHGLGRVERYWNVKFDFASSATDPGGFTWRVPDASASPTHSGTNYLIWTFLGLGWLLVLGSALMFGFRRRRRKVSAPAAT
jgi:hypothetical protein